ncbi:uncharacterized protein DEA37_0011026 [Paragonimus westermani]|uniref:Ig-like domain-containing protein n=1 Tax=Paragonimus westermani TaxID=34504 RepID=A0A5J4NQ42_9TREM|nr:uncharacterized protein DEA37_0011026 [Paragonimus westermani]
MGVQSLYLNNLTSDDIAVFQCQLSNTHGWRIANGYVNVWEQPPAIVHSLEQELVIAENHPVLLRCETVGAPKAVVEWVKDGYTLFSSNRSPEMRTLHANFRITNEGNLFIEHTDGEHTIIIALLSRFLW